MSIWFSLVYIYIERGERSATPWIWCVKCTCNIFRWLPCGWNHVCWKSVIARLFPDYFSPTFPSSFSWLRFSQISFVFFLTTLLPHSLRLFPGYFSPTFPSSFSDCFSLTFPLSFSLVHSSHCTFFFSLFCFPLFRSFSFILGKKLLKAAITEPHPRKNKCNFNFIITNFYKSKFSYYP